MSASAFAALLQSFFTDRLLRQMRASANTVSSYRDTFRILLRYTSECRHRRNRAPESPTSPRSGAG